MMYCACAGELAGLSLFANFSIILCDIYYITRRYDSFTRSMFKWYLIFILYGIIRKTTLSQVDAATALIALGSVVANECSHVPRLIDVSWMGLLMMIAGWAAMFAMPFLVMLVADIAIPAFAAAAALIAGISVSLRNKSKWALWYFYGVFIVAGGVTVLVSKGYNHNSRIGGPLIIITPLLLSLPRVVEWIQETYELFEKLERTCDAFFTVRWLPKHLTTVCTSPIVLSN